MKKDTYAGRVKNTGAQFVEAPFQTEKKSAGKVIRGEDLRTGKKKGKK